MNCAYSGASEQQDITLFQKGCPFDIEGSGEINTRNVKRFGSGNYRPARGPPAPARMGSSRFYMGGTCTRPSLLPAVLVISKIPPVIPTAQCELPSGADKCVSA